MTLPGKQLQFTIYGIWLRMVTAGYLYRAGKLGGFGIILSRTGMTAGMIRDRIMPESYHMEDKMKRGTIVVIILAALTLSGCEWLVFKTDVEYRVTGNVPDVSITIENSSGGTSQYDPASLPWSYAWTVKGGGYTFLYVSAQNNYSSGTITSSIYVDGSLYRTSTSSGAYVIATASGSIGSY